jgi:cell wall-associated NlpC family hydrolase
MGMFGHDVRVLQDFLSRVGVRTSVDGQYGRVTRRSVRRWQSKSSLRRNGRMSRRNEAILRGQVQSGQNVFDLQSGGGASAPAPAPAAPAGAKAALGADGHAVAPASAPAAVKSLIAAANRIVGKPYRYGGGHGKWEDTGYDCSGSDSYALHGGGLLNRPMTSGEFESYGDAGPGAWITIYGSGGHSYLVVAGLRFDTGFHPPPSGPQWSTKMRPSDGYVARHPVGY